MVPLDRATANSYRLSLVAMSPCAMVWLQFLVQLMQGFSLLVAISQKQSALPSDSWAYCFQITQPFSGLTDICTQSRS